MEKEKNKNQYRQNGRQRQKTNRNKSANSTKNNDQGSVAGTSGISTFHNRNDRNNNNNKKTFEATHPMAYKTLETVLKGNNDAEIISKLSSPANGFLLRLDQQSINPDFMCLILRALARVSKSSTETDTRQLITHFYQKIIQKLGSKSNFHRELKLFIADLSNHFVVSENLQRQKYVEAIENLLVFLRRLQLTLYQNSFDAVRDLMNIITAQIDFINRKGNLLNDYIVETVMDLNESVEKFAQMRYETELSETLLEPPEDFRKIGIYPDTFDILSDHEPFIRANVIEGKYVAGIEHYLDVQFRLLREDFVRPLRNGITQYRNIRNNQAENAKKFRIDDLNIYRNVQILGSRMIRNDQIHTCKFDCTPFRNIRWQYNKRMMNGSLICLSQDDFETFFFATVAGQRDPEKLAKGEFEIKLEIENSATTEITPFITYVMVESHVYFESYRHNLKVLQAFGNENFPLEKYIVDVNKDISPPSYLSDESVYVISNGLPSTDPAAKSSIVEIMSDRQWPPREDFNLDESQYEAFCAALNKQMVIIQGPPGTGKTYIGLRIVEVLLNNTSQWPILIVCYTNHALDQFLEGILKYGGAIDLVRIGGKSQCQALEKLNLSHIKSEMKSKREVPSFIYRGRNESSYLLKSIQGQISKLEKSIERITKTVLGNELQKVIQTLNPAHYNQLFALANGRSFNEGILNWLGYAMAPNTNQQENNENSDDEDIEIESAQEMLEEQEMDEIEVRELEENRYVIESSDEESDVFDDDRETYQEPINLSNIVLLDQDADGFQLQKNNRKSLKRQIKKEILKSQTMEVEQANAIANINALFPNNRWNLYRLWIKLYVQEFENAIKDLRDDYRNECLRFDGLRKQEDIEIVKKAKIIGMTTTGAAKYRHIIDGTMPKITIVEEAAEVLEAHIVTALNRHTDHLILIGDHLQLRPNPAVYELAKKFNLEISLFERMINNQMEYYQLKEQHRMRPEISSLLVPHIYKQLLDHSSVESYEDVKGITRNMFFINHCKNEMSTEETKSHLNIYEAEFIVELCRYVILQGYETSQVTILTTYSGQLHQIRQLMRGKQLLNGVRVTVVDNYQGEECDIILLSFVRSNESGNIGFLKDSNRINVALSRAKKGLYCIGNFDCLAEKSQLWQKLISDLKAKAAIGDALELYCQNHTDYKNLVHSKDGFNVAPEGGCSRSCGYRLPCGHSCESVCHIIDVQHADQYKKCHKKCDQIVCERNHRCPKKCHYGKDCEECKTMVKKLREECGHIVEVKCSGDPALVRCFNSCSLNRNCGHKCKGLCGQPCDSIKCREKVQVKSPCGHKVTVNCANAKDNSKLLNACIEPCGIELKCGHLCKGSCGKCKIGRLHVSCGEKCGGVLICGHICPDTCSVECKPCKEKCTNSCTHSVCPFRCGDPCPPCKERCAWSCKHLQCNKLCSEPCDRELCDHPNLNLLKKCQHPSIGVCGEKMPKLCRICNKDEVEEIFFGNEDEPDARFIELEDCKHIIEVSGLIGWMTSEPASNESNPNVNSQNSIQFKKCPKCNTIIRRTKSLNTFIQASLRDIQQVKLKTCGDTEANKATQRKLFEKVEETLKNKPFDNDPLHLKYIFQEIRNKSELKKNEIFAKPNQTLNQLSNQFELVEGLRKICEKFINRNKSHANFEIEVLEQFNNRLQMAASFIRQYTNCEQQRFDIASEWKFLQMMCDVIVKGSDQPFNETGKKILNDAFKTANGYGCATDTVRSEFQENVALACKHSTGIGIFVKEKEMIIQAMGLSRGHWYKCPKGHVYCIGECGGAMERSECPDCGATIGGDSHRLDEGNAVATEMDGATRPSWPQ